MPAAELAPPDPDDPDLYAYACRAYAAYQAKKAAIEQIKTYLVPWQEDRRMRVMGKILRDAIERFEREADAAWATADDA